VAECHKPHAATASLLARALNAQIREKIMESNNWYKSAWFPIYNSILFIAFGLVLLNIYGTVHWNIFVASSNQFEGELKNALFRVMNQLSAYRICGGIALVFSIWGCFLKPRWSIVISSIIGLAACFLIVVTM
jgi:hypothetical protein